ncbi:hypothetical protein ACJRO7_007892 [Eucalyptus globulus]|uniref:Uncharacterized protein n=1 Tax=Eucalyptus globulus TaxID=34317 RepID=A0ABD3IPN5_EUCGL
MRHSNHIPNDNHSRGAMHEHKPRNASYAVLQSWVSKKFMTGCVVPFPVAVTFFYHLVIYSVFFMGFSFGEIPYLLPWVCDIAFFIFCVGIFASSWMGATVFWLGEWFIKRMPFMKHIYSASKLVLPPFSVTDQNSTAFKEVAIIRHPRLGNMHLRDDGDKELCSVYVPTNHLYIGDTFLVNSKEIIRPNLSIRKGIEIIVSASMTMPQMISPIERVPYQSNRILLNRMM